MSANAIPTSSVRSQNVLERTGWTWCLWSWSPTFQPSFAVPHRCTYWSCDKFEDLVHTTVCIKSTPVSFSWLAQGFDKLLLGLCGLFLGRVGVPTAHPFWVGRSLAHQAVSSVDQGDPGCSNCGKYHFLTSRGTPGLPPGTPSHQIILGECSLMGNHLGYPSRSPSGYILSVYFI